MEQNLDSTYTCYVGIFSMIASVTFNILYTSSIISKYETHISNLEKRLESFLQRERSANISLLAKIQDLENKLKKTNKKTNEIESLVNVFIEDSNEILDYIEENIHSINNKTNNNSITM
jgi:Fe2+ transport system protein B